MKAFWVSAGVAYIVIGVLSVAKIIDESTMPATTGLFFLGCGIIMFLFNLLRKDI